MPEAKCKQQWYRYTRKLDGWGNVRVLKQHCLFHPIGLNASVISTVAHITSLLANWLNSIWSRIYRAIYISRKEFVARDLLHLPLKVAITLLRNTYTHRSNFLLLPLRVCTHFNRSNCYRIEFCPWPCIFIWCLLWPKNVYMAIEFRIRRSRL